MILFFSAVAALSLSRLKPAVDNLLALGLAVKPKTLLDRWNREDEGVACSRKDS